MRILIIISAIVLHAYAASAQKVNTEGDLKVLNLVQQANQITNPNEAQVILMEAIGYKEGLSDSVKAILFAAQGIAYAKLYKNDSAKYYLQLVIAFSQSTKDTNVLIRAYNGLGNIYRTESNNDAAMKSFSLGLKIASENKGVEFRVWESKLYGAVAGIYYDLGDFDQALNLMDKSLKISLEIGDELIIATSYTRMGYLYSALKEVNKAIEVSLKAQEYLKSTGDSLDLIYNYYGLGSSYLVADQLDKALANFIQCQELSKKFSEIETQLSSQIQVGKIHLIRGQKRLAQEAGEQVLLLAKEQKIPLKLKDALELLASIAEAKGDYRLALSLQNQYYSLKDSIGNVEIQNRINELNAQYESEKKELEISTLTIENRLAQSELNEKRIFQVFLSIIIFMILGGSIFVFITQRQKSKLSRQAHMGEISEMRIQIKELLGKYEGRLDTDMETLNKKLVNPLSEREFDIFSHIFSQKSNQEIADLLFVSINTVKTHLKNIYSKLGVSNRKEALDIVLKSQS